MYRPLFSFRHVIYEMSKELFDENKNMNIGLQQVFNLVYFTGCTHLLYITLVLYDESMWTLYDFHYHDTLLAIIYHFREELEYTTILMLYPFSLLYLVLEYYTFKVDVRSPYWRYWWQTTVLNLDQYRECQLKGPERQLVQANKELKCLEKASAIPFFGNFIVVLLQQTILLKWIARAEIAWNLEFVDLEKISQRPIALLPHASWTLRRKTLFIQLYFEELSTLSEIALFPIYWVTIVVFSYLYPDWSGHHIFSIGFGFIEIIIGYFVLHNLARFGLFFTYITILGTVGIPKYLIAAQNLVKQMCLKRKSKKAKFLPLKRLPLLDNFFFEHTRLTTIVVECSHTLYGPGIFAAVLTMIPSNIIFVHRIFLDATPASLRFIFSIVFIIQIELVILIFVPLSWCHQVYHSPKKFIPSLLLKINRGRGWIMTKLKYDDLYGRLVSGPKLGLCIGPMHTITYFSSLELLFLYISYLLMAFSASGSAVE